MSPLTCFLRPFRQQAVKQLLKLCETAIRMSIVADARRIQEQKTRDMLPSWIDDCTIATFPKTGRKIEYWVTSYPCSCGIKPQTKVYPKRGSSPDAIAQEMRRKIDAVRPTNYVS